MEAGDVEAPRDFYAPNAQIWHNTDETASSVDENLDTLGGFVRPIRRRL